jgi:hypothetical protein
MGKKWSGGVDETGLTQDEGMWQAVVTAVLKFRIP